MTPYEVIRKKRDGEHLSAEEIVYFLHAYANHEVTDYHMAAFMMAVYFNGMSAEETSRTATLIREVNQTATIVVVEHDMLFIREIAKKVTVFHQGRIVREAAVEEIMRDPLVRDIYLGKRAA